MATYKNLELRDNIRNDALLLMKEKNISYEDAYEEAKQKLIGNQNINDFEFKPLTTVNSLENTLDKTIVAEDNKVEEVNEYLEDLKSRLKNLINVELFSEEQLEEFVISKEMGVDITKFADPGYNPEQIKYLSMQLLLGKEIDQYKGNYTFIPEREIVIESLDAEK